MPNTITEQELLALERRYRQALQHKDVEAAVELTADPCIITGGQGVGSVDRATYEAMMKNAAWEIVDFDIADDVLCRSSARTPRSSCTPCTND